MKPHRSQTTAVFILLLAVLATGAWLRSSGLFRGLDQHVVYHPDSPKQVSKLAEYLEGDYARHQGSLFYDGYPYGLNRVDELIIRAVGVVATPLREHVTPADYAPPNPSKVGLYYLGRVLRVLYGVLTILLIYRAVRALGVNRWCALGAAMLYAVSPLGIAVPHCVTGDVGVDLFVAAAIWCLARYAASGQARWLLANGAACGMAFACKYQGALALWMVMAAVVLISMRERKGVAGLVKSGLLVAAAFLAGVVAGTPALMSNPGRHADLMVRNFEFIKNYNVTAEFLAKPFLEKARIGVTENLPVVLDGIGWALALVTLAALFAAFVRWRQASPAASGDRSPAVVVAIASFTFVAMLLAMGLKPRVQPFHFSFLVPGMAVAAGVLAHWCWDTRRTLLKSVSVGLLLVTLAESGAAAKDENFFWRRSETTSLASAYARLIYEAAPGWGTRLRPHTWIKSFQLEPSALSVFRNSKSGLIHANPDWWRKQHQLPAPSVPLPLECNYIFVNGPIFPRNDRMFVLPASGPGSIGRVDNPESDNRLPLMMATRNESGRWLDKTLVFNRKPDAITLGLRTGCWPARYDLCGSGDRQSGYLTPHSQKIISIEPKAPRFAFKGKDGADDTYLYPLSLRAQLGPVWVTVLDDQYPQETANYVRFGPASAEADVANASVAADQEMARQMASLKYLEGAEPFSVPADKTRLPGDSAPLAAGTYVWTADVLNTGATQRLKLELVDLQGLHNATPPFETDVSPGLQRVSWRFAKAFAPYDASLFISCERVGLTVHTWSLKPDLDGLAQWRNQAPGVAAARPAEKNLNVRFPGIGTVRGISIPEKIQRGSTVAYQVRLDLDEHITHSDFHSRAIFLHLKTAEERIIASLDIALRDASTSPDARNWKTFVVPVDTLEPGAYRLDGGLYNPATGRRESFTADEGANVNRKRKYFQLATLVVE